MSKKLPCADFCDCGSACENMDSDPVLKNNNFPLNDGGEVNDNL